ncbi:MAG: NAD(P)/FAD-dependent oxidoreductase [Candidatus Dadabacteria bacterium]|nr:MAG: NAD(P)/FAD-dependent oxidoreductase [Candidatus Dadabacteria bacterium]
MSAYDAIVVGAGINGLTAACTLAKSGKRVILLEARSEAGGVASALNGSALDTATLSEKVVNHLSLKSYGLKFYSSDPGVLVSDLENEPFVLYRAPERMRFNDRECEAAGYRRYRTFITRISALINELRENKPPNLISPDLSSVALLLKSALRLRLLGKRDMTELLRVAPMCLADFLYEYFESETLITALALPALVGEWAGPWSPGTATNLLLYECARGLPVEGGSQEIIRALLKAAEDYGVTVKTDCRVKSFETDGDRVCGVLLESGKALNSKVVFSSPDPKTTFLKLLPAGVLESDFEWKINNFRQRGTTAFISIVLPESPRFKKPVADRVDFIRITGTVDELEQAFDPVKYGELPERPALDLQLHHQNNGVFIAGSVNFVPYCIKGEDYQAAREQLSATVISMLSELIDNLKDNISETKVWLPVDLESEFGCSYGNLRHGEAGLDQILVRPAPECARYKTPLKGLYICGSGAHPAGALSGLQGYLAANCCNV